MFERCQGWETDSQW